MEDDVVDSVDHRRVFLDRCRIFSMALETEVESREI